MNHQEIDKQLVIKHKLTNEELNLLAEAFSLLIKADQRLNPDLYNGKHNKDD